jgi:zeaxanthin glucosyltransferase
MGTLQNRLMWVFRAIAEACAGLEAQLVLALGGGGRGYIGELAGKPDRRAVCAADGV